MDALSVQQIPSGGEWLYEPKWDGFRCLAFRDGVNLQLQSKSGQRLDRYFPELAQALLRSKERRFVLDGEIVVPAGKTLSFDALLMRIHPAASRIKKLAEETPARLMVFDFLCDGAGKSLLGLPLEERRKRLERTMAENFARNPFVQLSPSTGRLAVAQRWLADAGAGTDGIIAKLRTAEYRPGDRSAMQKVKPRRSADCVVGGFRYAEGSTEVGSLLLGLYDRKQLLHHVGFCSGLKAVNRAGLTKKLERLVQAPGFTGRAPGGPSRWSTKRSSQWKPLKAKLVVEVGFDHVTNERFRHGTRFLRWRPDKVPNQCRMEQLHQKKSILRKAPAQKREP